MTTIDRPRVRAADAALSGAEPMKHQAEQSPVPAKAPPSEPDCGLDRLVSDMLQLQLVMNCWSGGTLTAVTVGCTEMDPVSAASGCDNWEQFHL